MSKKIDSKISLQPKSGEIELRKSDGAWHF
jgi:hypothetical protein